MKKVNSKKMAIASILTIGILFLIITGMMLYGIKILYDFNSGLPGAFALAIIGVWVVHDLVSMLNSWVIDNLSEMNLDGVQR